MSNLDRFDHIVFTAIGVLVLAIVGVVAFGNNIGVQIESFSPEANAQSDDRVRIRFFNQMDAESVNSRFSVSPEVEGEITWRGDRELIFVPDGALNVGETYTVEIAEGAESEGGSAELKDPLTFSFRVQQPSVVYLAPAGAQQRNIYIYDLNTEERLQITDAPYGIADYAVSPDNTQIVYTRYNEQGTADLWLYDLPSGSTQQLTNCVNASCGAPSWKPDGTQIAYEREEYDVAFGQPGARRVWLLDLVSSQSFLLFEDTQITGHSPNFAPDGNRIAIFSSNPPGILVYDFVSENRVFVENLQGVVGSFSPNGEQIVYPILVRGAIGNEFYSQLEMIDFIANQRIAVTGPSESPIEDRDGVWRPNSENELAVTRRYFDDRFTDFSQIYLLNIDSGEAEPLVVDNAYSHGSLGWSPDGNLLVMQRFEHGVSGARPAIWVYNLQSEALTMIADDAYFPHFIP